MSTSASEDPVQALLRDSTPFWFENVGKVLTKKQKLITPKANAGQLAVDAKLEEQRQAGKPMRAIILKIRQSGFSTWIQGKAIQRCTQRENYHAAVVAHDRETGGKLYAMGERFYRSLPSPEELSFEMPDGTKRSIKPEIATYRRTRFLHFADGAKSGWANDGIQLWPDSTYTVDTAGEFQAGRGATYAFVHASEVAFWDQIEQKLMALQNAVPDEPETVFIIESTANGYNAFKDEWDRAVRGDSEYIPFFWGWWQHEEYTRPFMNEAEEEAFVIGDGPYGDEEPRLVEHFDVSKEQLHWRRYTIANKCQGRVEVFHQEYPATPEEAFISTGRKVFDPYIVAGILVSCDVTDPEPPTPENPGPALGRLEPGSYKEREGRLGTITVPEMPLWKPRRDIHGPANWRLFLDRDDEGRPVVPDSSYVMGVDVSDADEEETDEPAWHAIEVIDHQTLEQVAEYRSRIDPDLLAALYFRNATVAVERTGSHGLPVLRKLWHDFHYLRTYKSTKKTQTQDKQEKRLGWDTNRETKPLMIAGGTELLREGTHGVKSRLLAMEMQTYTRDAKGKAKPERGKYSDLLMAWLIAQAVAAETPIRSREKREPQRRRPRDKVTGY
jgi:hypothetical protein